MSVLGFVFLGVVLNELRLILVKALLWYPSVAFPNSDALFVPGPLLPRPLVWSSMVGLPTSVLLNGGFTGTSDTTGLYQLTCPQPACQWTDLEQTLLVGRRQHVSLLIPLDFITCS